MCNSIQEQTNAQKLYQKQRQSLSEKKEKIMFIIIKKILAITYFLCFMNWSYPTASFQNDDVFVLLKTTFGFNFQESFNQDFSLKTDPEKEEKPPVYSKVSTKNPETAWIKSMRVGAKTFDSEFAHDGYSDYSNITFYASLSKGFWIAGKSGNGKKINHRWTVWIDFDKNGSFEESEIFIESTQTEFTRKMRLSAAIEKDFSTRMRVFYGENMDGQLIGEFEDYTLKVIN